MTAKANVLSGTRQLDYTRAPYTGWTRGHFADLADSLLLNARKWAGPGHAQITPPGPAGGYGRSVDGLEGFARTAMLAGFRLAGSNGEDPHGFAEWYAEGFRTGTDPHSPHAWVRPDEHDQAKVEAAALALALDNTREWLWDALDSGVQEQIIAYFSHVIHAKYPPINWVWFRVVVQQFLKSVGAPYSPADMEEDLALHDSFVRGDGWYSDGTERAFDHYNGWALHLYPVLWHRMAGSADSLAGPRRQRDFDYLDAFLPDAVALVGADGSPLIQGRSLIYRHAAAAPFWAGALAGSTSVPAGQLRRAASGVVKHFTDKGVPTLDGRLTLGWHHEWPALAQTYSGPGSPYWAAKGFAGLILPPEHPVWTDAELPLPVEVGNVLKVLPAPGWLLSATSADGVVRTVNHGNDHSLPGRLGSDSPLYARLGYSTATAPVVAGGTQNNPLEQSVTLANSNGEPSHRAGFTTLFTVELPALGAATGALAAASRATAHWVAKLESVPDHGSGYEGDVVVGAPVTTVSIMRGAWEVRLVRVDRTALVGEEAVGPLTLGGWPLAMGAGAVEQVTDSEAGARNGVLSSSIQPLAGLNRLGVRVLNEATPLSHTTAVPWAATDGPAVPGRWYAAAIGLGGAAEVPPRLAEMDMSAPAAVVHWADNSQTSLELPEVQTP